VIRETSRNHGVLMKPISQNVDAGRPASEPVGLIGLGLMGTTLAQRLRRGRLDVWGYDIDPGRHDLLVGLGGKPASSAADVASACGRILLSLPDSDAVEAVLADVGPSLVAGRIIVDTSTGASRGPGGWSSGCVRSVPGFVFAVILSPRPDCRNPTRTSV
jgi:hypothetical protein